MDSETRIKIVAQVLERLELTKVRELGSGFFGWAYLLSDGRVLKITRDSSEYEMASNLIGKKLKHIVEIYDTFVIKLIDYPIEYYGVIEEYVETPFELSNWESDVKFGMRLRAFSEEKYDQTDLLRYVDDAFQDSADRSDWINQLWDLFWECKAMGFITVDLKSDNIGMKDGIIKLFDTGYSGSSITKKTKIYEFYT